MCNIFPAKIKHDEDDKTAQYADRLVSHGAVLKRIALSSSSRWQKTKSFVELEIILAINNKKINETR